MTNSTTKKKRVDKPVPELPINPFAFEVLELASKQRSKAKKVEVLQKYEHDSLKAIFIWNFDDSVISLLPPGDVPYGDAEDQSVYSGSLSDNILKRRLEGSLRPHRIWMGGGNHLSAKSGRCSITSLKVVTVD